MGNNYRKDYNFSDSSRVYILAILVPFIATFIASFILFAIASMLKVEIKDLTSNIFVYSLLLLVSQGSLLLVAFLYSKLNKIDIYNASKINTKINIKQILVLCVISVVSLYLLTSFVNFTDSIIRSWGYNNSSELPFAINSWWSYLIGLVVMALLPAVCEETIFRGIVYNGVKNKYGVTKAVIISALCFCIMHMSLQQMIYPLVLGVVLALIVEYTGSLRASMFVHFLNNAIVVTVNFISSFVAIDNTEEVMEINLKNGLISVAMFVAGLGVIFGALMLLRHIKNKKQNNLDQKVSNEENVNNINKQENTEDEVVNEQANILTNSIRKTADKTEIVIFIVFIAISVVFWVVENMQHFK